MTKQEKIDGYVRKLIANAEPFILQLYSEINITNHSMADVIKICRAVEAINDLKEEIGLLEPKTKFKQLPIKFDQNDKENDLPKAS